MTRYGPSLETVTVGRALTMRFCPRRRGREYFAHVGHKPLPGRASTSPTRNVRFPGDDPDYAPDAAQERAVGHTLTSKADLHVPSDDDPVIGVIKVKVDPLDAPALVAEANEVLDAEAKHMPGFCSAQLLVSLDNTTIIIFTEWSDHHAWGQSRYDARVGKMVEHCNTKSTTIEFELYTRRGDFHKATGG